MKETLKILFVRAFRGEMCVHAMLEEGQGDTPAMYLRCHAPILRAADGRPLLAISYIEQG